MAKRLWILGAGGFGREVFDWASDVRRAGAEWEIAGFLDDDADALAGRPCDLPLVGPISGHAFAADDLAVIAIAHTRIREKLATDLAGRVQFTTLIHPSVVVGSHSPIGVGTILCPGVIVSTNANVGEHCHANLQSTITHDVTLEPFCTLSDHVDLCGGVYVERGAFFGSHASVTPRLRIGAFAKLGAGSVALKDVPPETIAIGVPARPFRSPVD